MLSIANMGSDMMTQGVIRSGEMDYLYDTAAGHEGFSMLERRGVKVEETVVDGVVTREL